MQCCKRVRCHVVADIRADGGACEQYDSEHSHSQVRAQREAFGRAGRLAMKRFWQVAPHDQPNGHDRRPKDEGETPTEVLELFIAEHT